MDTSEREKWTATVFVDNRPASDHVSYRITPQRGPYGTMFAEDAFKAAAAPELYEALREAMRLIGDMAENGFIAADTHQHGYYVPESWFEHQGKALAKARGELK